MDSPEPDPAPKPVPVCAVCLKDIGPGDAHVLNNDRTLCLPCHEAERRVLRRLGLTPPEA